MKKNLFLIILGLLIFGLTAIGFNLFEYNDGVNKDVEQYPIFDLTEFKNGRWICKSDSLAGLEIRDGKIIMFYQGHENDSADVYDIFINREYLLTLGTEHKPFEFLRLTNSTDTLEYSILGYNENSLSLMYLPRGNLLIYEPEN